MGIVAFNVKKRDVRVGLVQVVEEVPHQPVPVAHIGLLDGFEVDGVNRIEYHFLQRVLQLNIFLLSHFCFVVRVILGGDLESGESGQYRSGRWSERDKKGGGEGCVDCGGDGYCKIAVVTAAERRGDSRGILGDFVVKDLYGFVGWGADNWGARLYQKSIDEGVNCGHGLGGFVGVALNVGCVFFWFSRCWEW